MPSPLAQGRGLKLTAFPEPESGRKVAPRTGAWIETLCVYVPFNKAWSPLAQGRGLKPRMYQAFSCR